jgi:glycosyltransferase involved in cell wall biosynthesis
MGIMQTRNRRLFIDALALVPERKSGVGQTLEQTFESLSSISSFADNWEVYLVVPLGKAKHLKKYKKANVGIKTIYLPSRLMSALLKLRIMPPLDIFVGKGVFLFPNYRNWPLLYSRSLTYVYDIGFILYPETVKPNNRSYLRKNIKKWIARTDVVITITNQVKIEIERYLHTGREKIRVIYCGVDVSTFYHRDNTEIDKAKLKYNVTSKNYILFVGNIEPRKNISVLIDAYESLPKALQNRYGLVIVGGDGWLNEDVVSRIDNAHVSGLNIYRVKKYVSNKDLPAIYSGASVLVHPAIYEGFGMTPLEAMACNTPILVSEIGALKEVFQDSAAYFNPHDVKQLTKELVQILSKNRIGLSSELRVRELSWENTAKDLFISIKLFTKTIFSRVDKWITSFLTAKDNDESDLRQAKDSQELLKNIYESMIQDSDSPFRSVLFNKYKAIIKLSKKAFEINKLFLKKVLQK